MNPEKYPPSGDAFGRRGFGSRSWHLVVLFTALLLYLGLLLPAVWQHKASMAWTAFGLGFVPGPLVSLAILARTFTQSVAGRGQPLDDFRLPVAGSLAAACM